jgi:methylphosphotriester-DNA--protein-cysteine methyltransferase
MVRLADTPIDRADTLVDEFARLTGDPGPLVRACLRRPDGCVPGAPPETIRAATGRTPSARIREARVRAAKRLLASTDLTVRQIAEPAGFAAPAYFCWFFRRETRPEPGRFPANR